MLIGLETLVPPNPLLLSHTFTSGRVCFARRKIDADRGLVLDEVRRRPAQVHEHRVRGAHGACRQQQLIAAALQPCQPRAQGAACLLLLCVQEPPLNDAARRGGRAACSRAQTTSRTVPAVDAAAGGASCVDFFFNSALVTCGLLLCDVRKVSLCARTSGGATRDTLF